MTLTRTRLLSLLFASLTALATAAHAAPAWHVVHGEFFDLYSNSGKAAAIDAATWIEQFRRTVGSIWRIEPTDISRATIVQFRSEKDFAPYGGGKYNGGFFFRNELVSVMAYRADNESDAVRSLVQHEGVHWLLASRRGRLPAWLNEGLAELYSTFSINGKTCRLFQADEPNLRWLQANGIDSLDAVLAHARGDLDFDDREKVRDFYAQSWAITHYFLCGTKIKDGRERIVRYLELVQGGMSQRDAFEPALGLSIEAMRRELKIYINGGHYQVLNLTFARDELRAKFTAEVATEVEIECALARALLAGRRDRDAAETRFRRAREAAPDSPLPYEGLGAVAHSRGDWRKAAEMFATAAALGSRHPYAYFLPAADELNDRVGARPTRHDLRAEDARRLADALIVALEIDRNLDRGAYDLGLALLFTEPLLKKDVQQLARLESTAEDPLVVRYRLAGLLHRLGDARARTLLETLATVGDNDLLSAAAAADLKTMDSESGKVVIGARSVLKPRAKQPGFSIPISRSRE